MGFLNTFSLRRYASLLLGLLAVAAVAIGLCQWRLDAANHRVAQAYQQRYVSTQLANELRRSSDDLTRLARTYVATGDAKWEQQYNEILAIRSGKAPRPLDYDRIYWDFRAADEPLRAEQGETISLQEMMKRAGFTDEEFAKLHDAEQNSNDLVKTETVAMNLVKGLTPDDAGHFTKQGSPDLEKARALMFDANYHRFKAKIMHPIDDFLKLLDARTEGAIARAQASAQTWKIISAAVAIGILAFFALMLHMMFKRVLAGLEAAASTASRVAAGDLTSHFDAHRVDPQAKDEISRVMRALQTMNDGLVRIVTDVRSGTDTIATASHEIMAGNNDLSARTEQQAASLQETAASMSELTATVKLNLENARQANMIGSNAVSTVEKGSVSVEQLVTTVNAISTNSGKIADIISLIEGIAFQTNILALNAAVEAARAGQAGRGFAVVAQEVRGLAHSSAQAAKEISALIADVTGEVELGADTVKAAGSTIVGMLASVRQVATLVDEISHASDEQRSGIDQVSRAVAQMDEMTQHNALLVQKAAGAAGALADEAAALREAAAIFRVVA